tara:strand:+ start:1965 stop:2516 length:552 start_codon:yes stop_codon:yes gene_type:complete
MSDVNSLIADLDSNKAYYDPSASDSPTKKQIADGTYEAIVTKLTVKKDITIKGEFLADIFEAVYTINADKHPEYKGSQVKSKGYFRFKQPDPKKYPNLKDNAGQNKGYMIFCEACGFEIVKNEEGKFELPMITEGDISGNPVTIKVEQEEWTNRDGEKRTSPIAFNVFKSDTVVNIKEDELPF